METVKILVTRVVPVRTYVWHNYFMGRTFTAKGCAKAGGGTLYEIVDDGSENYKQAKENLSDKYARPFDEPFFIDSEYCEEVLIEEITIGMQQPEIKSQQEEKIPSLYNLYKVKRAGKGVTLVAAQTFSDVVNFFDNNSELESVEKYATFPEVEVL